MARVERAACDLELEDREASRGAWRSLLRISTCLAVPQDSSHSGLPANSCSFTFVSPELFYVTTPEGQIAMYSVDATGYTHVASLLLPSVQASVFVHTFRCHTEQYRAKRSWRTASTLFEKQLHSFEITYLDQSDFTHHDFRMFAPTSLFIEYHALYLKRGAKAPIIASWDDWGPFYTRFQSADTGYHWLRQVSSFSL